MLFSSYLLIGLTATSLIPRPASLDILFRSSTAPYQSYLTTDSMVAAFSLERGEIKHLKGFGNLTNNDHIQN